MFSAILKVWSYLKVNFFIDDGFIFQKLKDGFFRASSQRRKRGWPEIHCETHSEELLKKTKTKNAEMFTAVTEIEMNRLEKS